MIKITQSDNCCGCTACYNICPCDAISMVKDEEGFLYPSVKGSVCVECGLCEKVCPIMNAETKKADLSENTTGYIVRNRDSEVVKHSTSGGAFSAFADYILSKSGVVFGAGYDPEMRVICKMAADREEIEEMRGSKFVQSYLGRTYRKIRDLLNDGTLVMFTGTPCQVSGLLSFLGNKPDNLICVDFVCRGVPSPSLWANYVDMMQKKYHSKIVDARFKNKTYGYHGSTMRVEFANGKVWYGSGRIDPMMKSFVTEMASRPSCAKCSFKGVKRPSDITMFDCYEFSSIIGKKDDEKGYSSILIHSELGRKIFDDVKKNFIIFDAPVDLLVSKNGIMACNSARPNSLRNEFYECAGKLSIDKAMQRVNPITFNDYIIEKSKYIIHKLGIITVVKRLKRNKSIEI